MYGDPILLLVSAIVVGIMISNLYSHTTRLTPWYKGVSTILAFGFVVYLAVIQGNANEISHLVMQDHMKLLKECEKKLVLRSESCMITSSAVVVIAKDKE
jgi:F0F1-type ATP synthase assembly protein I